MLKDNRIALTHLHITHGLALHANRFLRMLRSTDHAVSYLFVILEAQENKPRCRVFQLESIVLGIILG